MSLSRMSRWLLPEARTLLAPVRLTIPTMSPARWAGCRVVQDIEQRAYETHDEKNARLCRPLSPHLSIYRPQYTSIFSILHRISGTVVAVYITTFAACAIFIPYEFECWMRWLEVRDLSAPVLVAGKLVLCAPFLYHTCNGVRHLVWDTGRMLGLRHVLISGVVMSVCAATLTAGALLCV